MPVCGCCCSGRTPDDLGVRPGGRLKPPPRSPNCVCSDADATDTEHFIDALVVAGGVDPAAAWQIAATTMSSWKLATVRQRNDEYMHVECSTKFWGFTDDLELNLRRPRNGEGRSGASTPCTIAVRSASRLGSSDFGVNRVRVEALRSLLATAGVVESRRRASDEGTRTLLV